MEDKQEKPVRELRCYLVKECANKQVEMLRKSADTRNVVLDSYEAI